MGPKIYVAVEVFSQLFLRWCTPVMHPMSPSFTKPFKSLMLCTTGPLALLSSISRAYIFQLGQRTGRLFPDYFLGWIEAQQRKQDGTYFERCTKKICVRTNRIRPQFVFC